MISSVALVALLAAPPAQPLAREAGPDRALAYYHYSLSLQAGRSEQSLEVLRKPLCLRPRGRRHPRRDRLAAARAGPPRRGPRLHPRGCAPGPRERRRPPHPGAAAARDQPGPGERALRGCPARRGREAREDRRARAHRRPGAADAGQHLGCSWARGPRPPWPWCATWSSTPATSSATRSLSSVYLQIGQGEQAAASFERALDLQPDLAQGYEQPGRCPQPGRAARPGRPQLPQGPRSPSPGTPAPAAGAGRHPCAKARRFLDAQAEADARSSRPTRRTASGWSCAAGPCASCATTTWPWQRPRRPWPRTPPT